MDTKGILDTMSKNYVFEIYLGTQKTPYFMSTIFCKIYSFLVFHCNLQCRKCKLLFHHNTFVSFFDKSQTKLLLLKARISTSKEDYNNLLKILFSARCIMQENEAGKKNKPSQ